MYHVFVGLRKHNKKGAEAPVFVRDLSGRRRITEAFERAAEIFFLFCALLSILSVITITVYIFMRGGPAIFTIGVSDFVLGVRWAPDQGYYGILPMIIGSILATIGAVVLGVTIGIFTAIFMAEIAPPIVVRFYQPVIELLAGIPSIVYGFFGLVMIVPLIRTYLGGSGDSLLAVIIILGIMILPTIISISETSMRAVPKIYKEGSLALGATQIQTIFKIVLPAAKSGIITSIILGMGRAVGETMAVILVAGNSTIIPTSITSRMRTMTANIALEMGYAFGLHQGALFATGVILFLFIMMLNILLNVLVRKKAGDRS